MNISLTPELEKYVSSRVESGLYQTASEVVREGLRLLKEKEELHQRRLEELRGEIRRGIEQADRGEVSPFNEATLDTVKAEGKKRLAAKKAAKGR